MKNREQLVHCLRIWCGGESLSSLYFRHCLQAYEAIFCFVMKVMKLLCTTYWDMTCHVNLKEITS